MGFWMRIRFRCRPRLCKHACPPATVGRFSASRRSRIRFRYPPGNRPLWDIEPVRPRIRIRDSECQAMLDDLRRCRGTKRAARRAAGWITDRSTCPIFIRPMRWIVARTMGRIVIILPARTIQRCRFFRCGSGWTHFGPGLKNFLISDSITSGSWRLSKTVIISSSSELNR